MLLRRAIDLFLDGYFSTCERSANTITAYTADLHQFRQHHPEQLEVEAITPETLEEWAAELKRRQLAPATLRRKFAVLRVFFNYWVRKRILDRSPLWNLRLDFGRSRTLTRTFSPDEMSRLLGQARADLGEEPPELCTAPTKTFLALRNLAILEMLFCTGMRVGEAASLRIKDVRLDERTILVRGKGGRQRLAFLTDEKSYDAIAHYKDHRQNLQADTEAFLLNTFRRPLSTQGIAAMLRKQAKAAGITKHVTPHMLRHTAATFLLQNGADIRIVQEFLGHASITTTQRYTHIVKSHLLMALMRGHPGVALGRGSALP